MQTEDEIYEKLSDQFSEEVIKKGIEESINIADIVENVDIGLNKGNIIQRLTLKMATISRRLSKIFSV